MTAKDIAALVERVHALELELARAHGRLDQASQVMSTVIRAQRETAVAAPAKKAAAVAKDDRIDHADFMSALTALQGANPGRRFKSAEVVSHFRAMQAMAAAASTAKPPAQPVAEAAVLEDVDF